jgi:hypothetical protein
VLKLDTEGASAVRRAKVLELSTCEERRQFFIWEGGDASPWMTDPVVDLATGSRRAMYTCCARSFGAANRKHQEVSVMKKILAALLGFGRNRVGRNPNAFHDDTLRANQFVNPAHKFSFWRALVS